MSEPENRLAADAPKKRKAPKTAFKPGQSGNPGGRPPKTPDERALIEACRGKTMDALTVMETLMRTSKQDSVRLSAAAAIIDRGYGKSTERKEITNRPYETATDEQLAGVIVAKAAEAGLTINGNIH